MKIPINTNRVAHSPPPRDVYMQNNLMSILARPAGKEMKCFKPGIMRPMKADIGPCL